MLEVTKWLEQLSDAIEKAMADDPKKVMKALEVVADFSETPADSILLLLQSAFLVLLSFEKASKESRGADTSMGLFPALFYIAEDWSKAQVEFYSERMTEENQENLINDVYDIINKRGNHGDSEERDT